jgi:MFS family permease
VARLLWGTAWSGIWVAGNAIVLDVSHEGNRGRNIGYYNIAFFSGAGAGSFIGGALTDWLGYHGAMGVAAALAGLGALVAFFFLPETARPYRRDAEAQRGETGNAPHPSLFQSWRQRRHAKHNAPRTTRHVSLPILTILALLAVNRLIMAGMFFPTFGLYLREMVGETVLVRGRAVGVTTLTGFGLGLSTFLGMWFGLGIGHWSDRVKNRWGVAAAGLIPGMVGFMALAVGPAWGAAVAVPLNSMTSGSNQGMATVLLGHEVGEGERGRWLGTLFTVGDLASAMGPLLTFALLESVALVWLYILAAILLAAMGCLATFTAYRLKPHRSTI